MILNKGQYFKLSDGILVYYIEERFNFRLLVHLDTLISSLKTLGSGKIKSAQETKEKMHLVNNLSFSRDLILFSGRQQQGRYGIYFLFINVG